MLQWNVLYPQSALPMLIILTLILILAIVLTVIDNVDTSHLTLLHKGVNCNLFYCNSNIYSNWI